MLKSFSLSKRPLPNPTLPNEVQSHKCYFHDSYFISKFCTNNKCTLPLCQKCIPIHIKQHLKEEHILGKQNIIPFSSAYQTAIQNLQTIILTKNSIVTSIKEQLQSTKIQIEDLLQRQFSKIQQQISLRQNEIKIITQKFAKIKKGSLKTLIFYFSDEEIIKTNKDAFFFGQNTLSQIPFLVQNLKNTLNNFSSQSFKQSSSNTSHPIRSNSQPKCEKNQFKNYSSSYLMRSNALNNPFQPTSNTNQSKQMKENDQPKKLQSSSDFSSLLKDHKSRLQSVRNKNLSFAGNYASLKSQIVSEKPGSKSVDNFYFTTTTDDYAQTKGQSETRPLQVISKNLNSFSVKSSTPKKTDLNSDSKQKLSKIKQKYIGDISLSKENIKNKSLVQNFKGQIMTGSNYSNRNTPMDGLKGGQNQGNKAIDLDNRILSRQQIRVNIQNRLNQRSVSLVGPIEKEKPDLTKTKLTFQGKKQHFEHKIKQQTLKQQINHQKIEQFTLNKNYQTGQSYQTLMTEMEKIPMSSIKRELRAELFEQHGPVVKKFFENNSEKVESFDVRDEKMSKTNDIFKIKHEITDFVLEKRQNEHGEFKKAKIIHRQNGINQPSKKDMIYDQAKQSIKLNQPNSRFEYENKQNSASKRKEGRRFNYLYEVSQQAQNVFTQKN